MKTIAVVNQKGGVGKTTTVVNLLTALSSIGKKCLLIDLDPQGNATTSLGINYEDRTDNIYQVIIGEKDVNEVICRTFVNNLFILPSVMDLSGAEQELFDIEADWQIILKNIIHNIKEDFDFIMIDCPPSLGVLTVCALVAAQSLIIPMQCEFFALEGLSHLLQTVNLIKKKLNTSLKIDGILLTMFDRRNKISFHIEEDLRLNFPDLVYKTIIPRNVKVAEAPSFGRPVLIHDLKSSGATAYIQYAQEILEKLSLEEVV